ncbi:hypothetical protein OG21DRAFT_1513229 [Imleria badia]|nr:hypothetical protein OG21DRAFT_1513229 [Imleria badia]
MTLLVGTTFGALLLGGLCAAALSGVVVVQTFLYIKLFPRDSATFKAMVGAVWMLDTMHSLLIYTSVWIYLITNYGNERMIDTIPIPLALTGLISAILTFIVHCFFLYRIHKLSHQQWQFTALILVLALFRLCCATVTTAEMIHMKTFTAFKARFQWVLTLGLAMSSLVDILVTWFLTHLLQTLQREIDVSTSSDRVITSVILYTFETNLLTSVTTILSMICWLTMPDNLIFLGLHFFIGKLYANSLLATLNARKQLRHQTQRGTSVDLPSMISPSSSTRRGRTRKFSSRDEIPTSTKLEITVSRTVEVGVDEALPSQSVKHVFIVQPQPK